MCIVASRLQRAKKGDFKCDSVVTKPSVKTDSRKLKNIQRSQSQDLNFAEGKHSGECAADKQSFAKPSSIPIRRKPAPETGTACAYVDQQRRYIV